MIEHENGDVQRIGAQCTEMTKIVAAILIANTMRTSRVSETDRRDARRKLASSDEVRRFIAVVV